MARPNEDTTVDLPDAPEDVVLSAGTRAPLPAQNASQIGQGQFDHLDILKVHFGDETETEFKIGLYLKALDPQQTSTGFPFRFVAFSYGKIDWRIMLGPC